MMTATNDAPAWDMWERLLIGMYSKGRGYCLVKVAANSKIDIEKLVKENSRGFSSYDCYILEYFSDGGIGYVVFDPFHCWTFQIKLPKRGYIRLPKWENL